MEKAKLIRLLAMDVDGVLTNGDIIYSDDGSEIKVFNNLDGQGITIAKQAGLMTAIVTGRASPVVQRRAEELGVTYICQGCRDKGAVLRRLIAENNLRREEVAFIGDDINDLLAFRECGWSIAVKNACADVKRVADHITEREGGHGAVREIIELILKVQGRWTSAVDAYLLSLKQA
jgi:3-deoxy-D-manno-octulosonate 8-phosphate phosphatase (KDO 8-P phosphatase)